MGPRRLRLLRGRAGLLIALGLAGCGGPLEDSSSDIFTGWGPLDDYMPYDGTRHAVYYGDGADYDLVVDKLDPVETIDGVEVATFAYSRSDDDSLLAQVKWAADGDGIRVVAAAEGTGGFTTFDPPIQLTDASDYMHVDDSVTTETGGVTWTSTLVGLEDIDVAWGLTWDGALHFSLTGGDGFFAGDYWLVTRYGPGWMDLGGVHWDLADYDWSDGSDTPGSD